MERKRMAFSPKEIKKEFSEESKGKLRAPVNRDRERDRKNLSEALANGDYDLSLKVLDALEVAEGTQQRKDAIRLFCEKHGRR
jgi:disulfide oxidoreductase YuzD